MSKILCVDFDGVISNYDSGWQGVENIPDPPVEGAIEWLAYMVEKTDYEIAIYSSRSKTPEGIWAMTRWLEQAFTNIRYDPRSYIPHIQFPSQKPPAYLTIDDRAICFRGTFPSILELDNFTAWNK